MDFILWLQSYSTPWLDRFFIAVTLFGMEEFYLLAIPLIYWCYNKSEGMRLATVFLLSMYLNSLLKDTLRAPRPTMAEGARILFAESGPGYSFPSGHAQGTVTFWGFVATNRKRFWFWVLAGMITVLVAVSRPYLGLHFPVDIIAGALIGALVLLLFFRLESRTSLIPGSIRQALLIAVAPLCTLPIYRNDTAGKLLGFFAGFTIGAALERQYVQFREQGALITQATKLLVGLGLVAALRIGLKVILPADFWGSWLRYALLGLSGTCLVPMLFIRLRLANTDETI